MESAYEKFHKKDVTPVIESIKEELERSFQEKKYEFKKKFKSDFENMCKEMEEEEGKTGYIIYTLLRTNIMEKKYLYPIYKYNKNWYMDKGKKVGELDTRLIYEYYEKAYEILKKEYGKYINKLSIVDVERAMLEEIEVFHKYVVELLRYSIVEGVEREGYARLKKEEKLEIQSGEYYEICDVVHIEQGRKEEKEIKNWLRKREIAGYSHQDFTEMNLAEMNLTNYDFIYTDFRKADLTNSKMIGNILIGTKFKEAKMREVKLTGSMMHGASFERADLRGSDFTYAIAYRGRDKFNVKRKAGYTEIDFRGSRLEGAKFDKATIIGGDFEGAEMEGASFEGAKLYGSKFTRKQMDGIELTKEQKEQIIIVG